MEGWYVPPTPVSKYKTPPKVASSTLCEVTSTTAEKSNRNKSAKKASPRKDKSKAASSTTSAKVHVRKEPEFFNVIPERELIQTEIETTGPDSPTEVPLDNPFDSDDTDIDSDYVPSPDPDEDQIQRSRRKRRDSFIATSSSDGAWSGRCASNKRRSPTKAARSKRRIRRALSGSESEEEEAVSPKRQHKPTAKIRENMAVALQRLQEKHSGWRWQPKVTVEDIFNEEEKKQLPAALGILDYSEPFSSSNSDSSEFTEAFKSANGLDTALSLMHTKNEKTPTYQCGTCDYQSTKRNHVVSHIKKKHLKNKPNGTQKSKNKPDNTKTETKTMPNFKYKCDKCQCPNLVSRAVFEGHRKHHGAVHRYTCRLCDFCHSGCMHVEYHMKHDHGDIPAETIELGPKDRYKGPTAVTSTTTPESEQQKATEFKCDRCWYFADTQSDLDHHTDYTHIDTEDDPSSTYLCVFCNYRAPKDGLVKRHMEVNHKKRISSLLTLQCSDGCEFSITQTRVHTMISHKGRHQPAQKFTCSRCSYGSEIRWVVEKHERVHHSKPNNLNSGKSEKPAKQAPSTKSRKRKKSSSVETTGRRKASVSDKSDKPSKRGASGDGSTSGKQTTTSQNSKSDRTSNSALDCVVPHCEFIAPNEPGLASHMRGHEPNKTKRFVCNICEWRSHNSPVLELHFKQSHSGRGTPIVEAEESVRQSDGRHYCRQCNYSTKHGLKDLESHMNRHQAGQAFNCSLCSYGSSRQVDINKHKERDHESSTPEPFVSLDPKLKYYKCDQCPFSTYDVFRYGSHRRKHHGLAE